MHNMPSFTMENVTTCAETELNNSMVVADNTYFLQDYVLSSSILKSVLMVIGVTANAILIITVLKQKKLRTSPTFIVLMSLAMADIILLIALELGIVINIVQQNNLKDILCKTHYYILLSCVGISANHLVLFAVIRFLTLVKPFFARRHVTTRKVFVICAVIWIVYLALSSFAVKTTLGEYHIGGNNTVFICGFSRDGLITDVLRVYFVVSLVSPVILVPLFHLIKLWILRKSQVQSEHLTTHQTLSSRAVYSTVFTFVCCWSPMIGFFLARDIMATGNFIWSMVLIYSPLLINIHSTLDPFLYFFFSKDLRKSASCWGDGKRENKLGNRQKHIMTEVNKTG